MKDNATGFLFTATADASKAAEEIPPDVATAKPSGKCCNKF